MVRLVTALAVLAVVVLGLLAVARAAQAEEEEREERLSGAPVILSNANNVHEVQQRVATGRYTRAQLGEYDPDEDERRRRRKRKKPALATVPIANSAPDMNALTLTKLDVKNMVADVVQQVVHAELENSAYEQQQQQQAEIRKVALQRKWTLDDIPKNILRKLLRDGRQAARDKIDIKKSSLYCINGKAVRYNELHPLTRRKAIWCPHNDGVCCGNDSSPYFCCPKGTYCKPNCGYFVCNRPKCMKIGQK